MDFAFAFLSRSAFAEEEAEASKLQKLFTFYGRW